MNQLTEIEPRSFLLVLIAFVGNGQIAGFDLVLTVLVPLALLLQLRERLTVSRNTSPIFLLVIIFALFFAMLRAPVIGIPYFEAYSLWPFKALILTCFLAFGPPLRWPMGNMLALVGICLILVAVGSFENGRLISVFGPNMLYRIFGFLLFFSAMLYFEKRNRGRLLLIFFAIFGLFAALMTGSSGALLVIAVVGIATLLRISRVFGVLITAGATYLVVSSGVLSGTLSTGAHTPAFFSRLLYKVATLQANDRIIGWTEIINSPFVLIGHSYTDFNNLWRLGYQYPHNLFVELYGFYGLIGIILIVLVVAAIFASVKKMFHGDIASLTFIVLFLGSMLSGDLSDNYGVIALVVSVLQSRPALKNTRRPAIKKFSRGLSK